MEINDAASILVIIISSLLGIFLIISIVALVAILRLVKSVKKVVAKAEDVVDSAEAVTEAFKNVSGPMSVLKLVKNLVDAVSDNKKGKK